MRKLLESVHHWLDQRTGLRGLVHEMLYENIPGGSRWRYVWGSTLVFAFVTQVITGFALWACYSPSTQTAWESVYFLQYEMQGGWLLRGIHHFMAQAMVVLLPLHLVQVVWDKAYKGPREINFWLGLVLMQIVLGLALTGYLLPWDQKGYWATRVATNLMSLTPMEGPNVQRVVVGGSEYGHHTLTRFFALHAGILPTLLVLVLVLHVALFRRHGLTPKLPLKRPDQFFWPHQVLKDAIACLGVLVIVLLCCIHFDIKGLFTGTLDPDHLGAELGAPADGAAAYAAARPEWYFLFLFQLLKYFKDEFTGAFVVPGIVMVYLFAMPFIGRSTWGHRVNVAVIVLLVAGAGVLTFKAFEQDHYHTLYTMDPDKFADDPAAQKAYREPFEISKTHHLALDEAEKDSARARELMRSLGGVGPGGALQVMRNDPETQGPKLFARYCASCHSYSAESLAGDPVEGSPHTAPNLYRFASREWLAGFLDPAQIKSPQYFAHTKHADGGMVGFVTDDMELKKPEQKTALANVVAALSAEAALPYQYEADREAQAAGVLERGRKALSENVFTENYTCLDCHHLSKVDEKTDLVAVWKEELKKKKDGPSLTGYGSAAWLKQMISDPAHFYVDNNDRMPAFAEGDDPAKHQLSPVDLDLLVRWLRREDETLAEPR